MKVFQEITEWKTEFKTPNHTYFLSDSKDKIFGYVAERSGTVHKLKAPLKFNSTYRKFKEVANTWGFSVDEKTPAFKGKIIKVKGSKGDEYTVTVDGRDIQCSCSGFKFRSKCKHAESVFATD